MKCPTCGTADTRVIETRKEDGGLMVRRRHECGNQHRFNTYQLHETALRTAGLNQIRARLTAVASGIAVRSTAHKRRTTAQRLLGQGKSISEVADAIGVTATRIRQYQQEQQA